MGELPLELQARLLRVLDSGEVKPVGANPPSTWTRGGGGHPPRAAGPCPPGRFREDLYYRLTALPLGVPPLRNRHPDIWLLAEHFVRLDAPREQMVTFTPAALVKLQKHLWPGNVRELRNVVCRALLVRKGPRLDVSDILFEDRSHRAPLELPEGVTLEQMMQQVERQLIESTLRRCDNHRDRAAKQLGLWPAPPSSSA